MTALPPFADFSRQLNTPFSVHTAHGLVEMQLVEAKELTPGQPEHARTPFSLLFVNHSQPNMVLSQGTYRLDHPALGSLSLFVAPVLSDRPSPDYQVIIN